MSYWTQTLVGLLLICVSLQVVFLVQFLGRLGSFFRRFGYLLGSGSSGGLGDRLRHLLALIDQVGGPASELIRRFGQSSFFLLVDHRRLAQKILLAQCFVFVLCQLVLCNLLSIFAIWIRVWGVCSRLSFAWHL